MSRKLKKIEHSGSENIPLKITAFFCGKKGMVQLSQISIKIPLSYNPEKTGFIQLTKQDAKEVIKSLQNWLKERGQL